MPEEISFREHEDIKIESIGISDAAMAFLGEMNFEGLPQHRNEAPKHLGIVRSGNGLKAHYYVGTTWIKEGSIYATIKPKIKNLDFEKMLGNVLRQKENSEYLSHCYGIDFGKKAIPAKKEISANLILLMVLHYIALLQNITKTGLRKDYITVEENLHSKVKGRILVSKNIVANDMNFRLDRVYCAYQTYTEDIPVNRLLKKALYKAEIIINGYTSIKEKASLSKRLHRDIARLKSDFFSVSSEVSENSVSGQKFSKLFRGYDEAVKVAKMILRQEANETDAEKKGLPPFWIDMTGLFELYVLDLLETAYPGKILFQVKGRHRTRCDYIDKDEGLIIDAKYKTWYAQIEFEKEQEWDDKSEETLEEKRKNPTDDIRELSGYARDTKILGQMTGKNNRSDIPPCILIYPKKNGKEQIETSPLITQCGKMAEYVEFYALGIKLPVNEKN